MKVTTRCGCGGCAVRRSRLRPSALREHDRNRDAADAQEAREPKCVVVLEVIVQRVKPTLEGPRLWPHHGDDDARLRDGAAHLQMGYVVEHSLDIDREGNEHRPGARVVHKPPTLRGQPDRNTRRVHHYGFTRHISRRRDVCCRHCSSEERRPGTAQKGLGTAVSDSEAGRGPETIGPSSCFASARSQSVSSAALGFASDVLVLVTRR
jgi:hypothetical protein